MVAKIVDQARAALRALGLPKEQTNERAGLTLLALLGLKPRKGMTVREGASAPTWSAAQAMLLGITEIMDYMRDHFGKQYKPNTRETVRRFTIHQFMQAGLVVQNPDDPTRPTNSPDNRYRLEPRALELLRTYGSPEWEAGLRGFLASVETLRMRYAGEREMKRIPLVLPSGNRISLSPGGQNVVVRLVLTEFCERFTPGARPVYIGDTDEKWAFFDAGLLADLGVRVDQHGKMPDVVVYLESKGWLVLVEAVTSHGPMSPKRVIELRELFKGCTAGLVFVTAFADRRTLHRYLSDIAWETEVWVADDPTHMIHFNGERFLGPYGRASGEVPQVRSHQ
ncbi:MAG: restriction endonuclease [Planctomycetes bacterium]|nr:restriction endonuclease [Planctomycetota bacterium]